MKLFVRAFISWLPLAVALTGVCLLVYGTVQQNYRQSLNDPQIQMAESAAFELGQSELNATVASVIPTTASDYTDELTPWLAVYDGSLKLLASSGAELKESPQPPVGVFESAKDGNGKDTMEPNENRVTWQLGLGPNGRQALVVVYVPERDLFVVAGRNMREVENREAQLGTFVGLAWLVLMAATFVTSLFTAYVERRI
jgi:hypothetical protein